MNNGEKAWEKVEGACHLGLILPHFIGEELTLSKNCLPLYLTGVSSKALLQSNEMRETNRNQKVFH